MSASVTTNNGAGGPSPKTLGDVLYAKSGELRVSDEAEWVLLVRAVGGGDQRALYALYVRMHRLVFTLAFRIVKSRETAEELTVDVFHDVWRRAQGYDPNGGGTVIGWIMNQARSRAIDRLRFEHRKKRSNPDAQDPTDIGTADTAALELESRDRTRALTLALRILSPAERQAIEMAFFGEQTYVQTALRLNEPVGTVKTRIRSGLTKLRGALVDGSEEA